MARACFNGVSLNTNPLQGPEYTNSLVGVLCRFRKDTIAICCDIQQFYNFLIKPEHRDYLRFLWFDKDHESTKESRMTKHLFGVTSSPGVATFALRKLADNHATIFAKASSSAWWFLCRRWHNQRIYKRKSDQTHQTRQRHLCEGQREVAQIHPQCYYSTGNHALFRTKWNHAGPQSA